MTDLTKSNTATMLTLLTSEALSPDQMQEILINLCKRTRRLENYMQAAEAEKKAVDAARMARLIERQEIESNGMRIIREQREKDAAKLAKVVADDQFMHFLDKDDEPVALTNQTDSPAAPQRTAQAPQAATIAPAAPRPIVAHPTQGGILRTAHAAAELHSHTKGLQAHDTVVAARKGAFNPLGGR
jgi:hypothetical protein